MVDMLKQLDAVFARRGGRFNDSLLSRSACDNSYRQCMICCLERSTVGGQSCENNYSTRVDSHPDSIGKSDYNQQVTRRFDADSVGESDLGLACREQFHMHGVVEATAIQLEEWTLDKSRIGNS